MKINQWTALIKTVESTHVHTYKLDITIMIMYIPFSCYLLSTVGLNNKTDGWRLYMYVCWCSSNPGVIERLNIQIEFWQCWQLWHQNLACECRKFNIGKQFLSVVLYLVICRSIIRLTFYLSASRTETFKSLTLSSLILIRSKTSKPKSELKP